MTTGGLYMRAVAAATAGGLVYGITLGEGAVVAMSWALIAGNLAVVGLLPLGFLVAWLRR